MSAVVLGTINARYAHASLGLRYLIANAGDLQDRIELVELVAGRPTEEMAERLLAHRPAVIGLGVYIWNVVQSTELVRRLKSLAPAVTIIVGGPEVSHEAERQEICSLADHVVQGPGDISFARLVRAVLFGPKPLMRVIAGEQPDLADLVLPYRHYTDRDLRERHVYVEASRGCPFKCEFCLSSLDKSARSFALDGFLAEMAALYERGARRFKFVDRTFNLKPATSLAIMDFFLARIEAAPADPCFVHFEVVPDHLPEKLKASISRFPAGTLQLEIGIQTFEPQVQASISRRQDNEKAESNLRWLLAHSKAHLHVDLIAGLPGETLASFGKGFDRLAAIGPHEIQVGVLKRLRGAPIVRHERPGGLQFDHRPPYEVLATDAMSSDDLQTVKLMARFHDLVVNSGRMPRLAARCMAGQPFDRLTALSRHLVGHFGRTHGIPLEALFDAVLGWLQDTAPEAAEAAADRAEPAALGTAADRAEPAALGAAAFARHLQHEALADYCSSGAKGRLSFMRTGLSIAAGPSAGRPARAPAEPGGRAGARNPRAEADDRTTCSTTVPSTSQTTPPRQRRHLREASAALPPPIDAAGPPVL